MLLQIRHSTQYSYERAGVFSVQRLRLTPRSDRRQTVLAWTVEASGIEACASYEDGYGNAVHLVTHCKPFETLTFTARGEVETLDVGGVIGETEEAATPRLFLRSTDLTQSTPAIEALARDLKGSDLIGRLHHLLDAIATRIAYVTDSTQAGTTAGQAFAAGKGVCQDHAHVFIAAARHIGVPARYVTGYLHLDDERPYAANHAWAEAYVPSLGWVGFDPANNICPTDRYVRLACGLDAVSASPITGARRGGGNEALSVDVLVRQMQQQQQ